MSTMDTLGMTSRWVAAARAAESARPDRLFDDPYAAALAGDEGRAFAAGMTALTPLPTSPGAKLPENPYLAIRTRYLDDLLADGAREGIRQIVILAAGMDARAFRLSWPEGTTVYEVERPEVLAYKESVLQTLGAKPKATRKVVVCDLRDDFEASLAKAGFDRSRPAFFVVEGLLVYLPDEAAAAALLSRVAKLAPRDSRVAMDLTGKSFLASPYMQTLCEALAAKGAPWCFGTDEPEAFVAAAGFADIHVVEPGEVGHGRWPYPVPPRSMPGYPRTWLVNARRRHAP